MAGDVEPEKVKLLAEKFYGKIERNNNLTDRIRPTEPPQIVQRRLIFEDERVAQSYLVRTYIAEERDTGKQRAAAAFTLLADLLGSGGIQSILGKELQLYGKKAIYTNAYYNGRSFDDTH